MEAVFAGQRIPANWKGDIHVKARDIGLSREDQKSVDRGKSVIQQMLGVKRLTWKCVYVCVIVVLITRSILLHARIFKCSGRNLSMARENPYPTIIIMCMHRQLARMCERCSRS